MQLQYDIIKLNTGLIPFSNGKYQESGKTSGKRKKNKEKNTVSANINYREALKIE